MGPRRLGYPRERDGELTIVRILFIDSTRTLGPGANLTIELAGGLAQRDHDVTVVCHPRGAIGERLPTVPGLTVAPVAIGTDFNPYRVLQLARVNRRVRPEVVLAGGQVDVTSSLAARRLGGGFPIVHRCAVPSQLSDSLLQRQVWGRELQALIVTSHAMRNRSLETIPWTAGMPIEVIPDGVDTTYFRPQPRMRQRVRAELGIPENAFVVSHHGTLDETDNLDLLVRAVAEIPRHLTVFALIVGAGPWLAETRRLATELRAPVIFTGSRTDMPAVLSCADVAASLSTAVACSSSVVESMACGLPVIVSDAACHLELVEDGVHGVLVPAKDWNSLTDAIRWLSADPTERQRMGRAALERAKTSFDLPGMIDRYEEVLQHTVEAFAASAD